MARKLDWADDQALNVLADALARPYKDAWPLIADRLRAIHYKGAIEACDECLSVLHEAGYQTKGVEQ
jgi:hypothetical protein